MATRKREPESAWVELHASSSPEPSIPPGIHEASIEAIEHKHRVTLTLATDVDLATEPHVYGLRGGRLP